MRSPRASASSPARRVVAVFGAAQALWAVVFVAVGHGSYLAAATRWDGGWYLKIASGGYPFDPARAEADSAFTRFAFYPVYPLLIRAVASLTPATMAVAAVTISLLCGAAAVTLLARTLSRTVSPRAGVLAGGFLSLWPVAPVLQMAYTEALALLLLGWALTCYLGQHWRWLPAPLLLLALTRPLLVPLALAMGIDAVVTWRRSGWPVAWRPLAASILTGALSLLWPLLVWLRTGDVAGYLRSEESFVRGSGPRSWASLFIGVGPIGWAFLAALTYVLGWVLVKALPREVPLVLRTWVGAYIVYCFIFTLVCFSFVRYSLFVFPLGLVLLRLRPEHRWPRVVLPLAGFAGGVVWIVFVVASTNPLLFP